MTAAQFRTIRLSLGLTADEWARWLGFGPNGNQHVSRLENGHKAITGTVAALARIYNVGMLPVEEGDG